MNSATERARELLMVPLDMKGDTRRLNYRVDRVTELCQENEILKQNVFDLQEQLNQAQIRIKELIEQQEKVKEWVKGS